MPSRRSRQKPAPSKRPSWVREHSLSIALGVSWAITNGLFFLVEAGHVYDFLNMLAGCFGGGFVMAVYARPFYERGADPLLPAEECE